MAVGAETETEDPKTGASSPGRSLAIAGRSGWWLRLVFVVTICTLVGEAGYVYLIRFGRLVHSDAACLVLMTRSALESHLPIADKWYFANGDVLFFNSIVGAIPVALFGVGLDSLRVLDALQLALALGALTFSFRQLRKTPLWLSFFAAVVTLLGISHLHFLFVFVETAYGVIATTYFLAFALFARALPTNDEGTVAVDRVFGQRGRWVLAAAWFAFVSLSNTMRIVPFGLAPLLIAGVWPWRGVSLRARLAFASVVLGSWSFALVVSRTLFQRSLTFAPYDGLIDFSWMNLTNVAVNVTRLGRALLALSGELGGLTLLAVPGLLLVIGALVLVGAEVLSSRTLTRERFAAVLLVSALGVVLGPAFAGDLLREAASARYLMPALLPLMGLAVILAYRRASGGGRTSPIAKAWLILVPLIGVLGFQKMVAACRAADHAQWANAIGHAEVAKELVRRDLRHGFSTYWNGNLISLLSNGATRTCPVFFGSHLAPQKWNIDSPCFDANQLPRQIYVVVADNERNDFDRARQRSLPAAQERFSVGTFDVFVFETAKVPLEWLTLPLTKRNLRFPLRMTTSHPAIERGHAEAVDGGLLATGERGSIVYGPQVDLPKGKYRIVWTGSGVASPGQIAFDAWAGGDKPFAFGRVDARALQDRKHELLSTLHVDLAQDTPRMEFRVFSEDGGKVALEELRIERE
jgi:hypothetical protein